MPDNHKRDDERLIKSVVADSKFNEYKLDEKYKLSCFKMYDVNISTLLKGFQPSWKFLILQLYIENENKRFSELSREINSVKKNYPDQAILVISDFEYLDLSGELDFDNDYVFFLDKNDIRGIASIEKNSIESSPLVASVKNKKTELDTNAIFNPYSPGVPALDWRFFGRRRELKKILDSDGSYFIVGSRRIGKTSLIEKLDTAFSERGHLVIRIACQFLFSVQELVNELKSSLSTRHLINLERRKLFKLDNNYIDSVVKELVRNKKSNQRIILIFDELGTVYNRNTSRDAWRFMGVLREYSQQGHLRIIASGWQDLLQNQAFHESPFVNFSPTIKLLPFENNELLEFFVGPLSIWCDIGDKDEVIDYLKYNMGSMPYYLQIMASELFQQVFSKAIVVSLITRIKSIIHNQIEIFDLAVDLTFQDKENFTQLDRYVFLKFCLDRKITSNTKSIEHLSIEDYNGILTSINVSLSFGEQLKNLRKYEYIGLMSPVKGDSTTYQLTAPVVYLNIAKRYPINKYLGLLLRDIKRKAK